MRHLNDVIRGEYRDRLVVTHAELRLYTRWALVQKFKIQFERKGVTPFPSLVAPCFREKLCVVVGGVFSGPWMCFSASCRASTPRHPSKRPPFIHTHVILCVYYRCVLLRALRHSGRQGEAPSLLALLSILDRKSESGACAVLGDYSLIECLDAL